MRFMPAYAEYTRDNGKLLGVYGEVHFYTKDESDFVRNILSDYDILLTEGTEKPDFPLLLTQIFTTPSIMAFSFGTKRREEGLIYFAKRRKGNVRVDYFDDLELIPAKNLRKACVQSLSEIPLLPIEFIKMYLRGDPCTLGTENNKEYLSSEKINKEMEKKCNNFKLNERNDFMVKKIAKNVVNCPDKNILVRCGVSHFDGITDGIEKTLGLKQDKFIEIENENGWKGLNKKLG